MPACMSELEGIAIERGGGLHWSQDETKHSRLILPCHPLLPSLSLSVLLIQTIEEYRHLHAVPAGAWRVVNWEAEKSSLCFCCRMCRRAMAFQVWVEQGKGWGGGVKEAKSLSLHPLFPSFFPPARTWGKTRQASVGGCGDWHAGMRELRQWEGSFPCISGCSGPSPRLTDLLSTFLLWVWRTSFFGHGLLTPRLRGAVAGRCSCGSAGCYFSFPLCGCVYSEVSMFLDLFSSWNNSKSWINRSVQSYYCCLPLVFLLSLTLRCSGKLQPGRWGQGCVQCHKLLLLVMPGKIPLLLWFLLTRANLASAAQLHQ